MQRTFSEHEVEEENVEVLVRSDILYGAESVPALQHNYIPSRLTAMRSATLNALPEANVRGRG